MITKDSKAARAFIDWLKMPLAHEVYMAQKSFVTPFKSVNAEAYSSDARLAGLDRQAHGAVVGAARERS